MVLVARLGDAENVFDETVVNEKGDGNALAGNKYINICISCVKQIQLLIIYKKEKKITALIQRNFGRGRIGLSST